MVCLLKKEVKSGFVSKEEEVVHKVDDVSLVDGVFDGAFGGDEDYDFVIGEGVIRRFGWKPWKLKNNKEKYGEDDEENDECDYLINVRVTNLVMHESERKDSKKCLAKCRKIAGSRRGDSQLHRKSGKNSKDLVILGGGPRYIRGPFGI
ncbi:hypothetical protein Tco_0469436 [Tanacetum coccineum]